MVEVLSELGRRTGIPSFYISFVLSPLISNGAEALAAYVYSQKKTTKTITIALATLLGASIMNASFVLAIFMLLLYARGALMYKVLLVCFLFVYARGRKKLEEETSKLRSTMSSVYLYIYTGLAWTFSAETIAILFVQVMVGLMALTRTQSLATAAVILSLYPLSLVLVWVMENVLGFD